MQAWMAAREGLYFGGLLSEEVELGARDTVSGFDIGEEEEGGRGA